MPRVKFELSNPLYEIGYQVFRYPENDEEARIMIENGQLDENGRPFRSGFKLPSKRSVKQIISDELEIMKDYSADYSIRLGNVLISKIYDGVRVDVTVIPRKFTEDKFPTVTRDFKYSQIDEIVNFIEETICQE